MSPHPCLSCGACCAYFRVSFYWAEPVPDQFTEKLNTHRSFMIGTDSSVEPRCVALQGVVGKHVSCGIYGNRPSPCREFEASFESGVENTRCSAARKAKGLSPLTPGDWK
ncbi:MAG: YkgJ family cysteine cluster protein [Bdellovibrionales bacterium]|nr:YkgJ family cysteine cluster protein [Bdellovibrionales bacterium]